MAQNYLKYAIALLVAWLLTTWIISPFLGIGFSLVAGLLFAAGLLYIGKWFGFVKVDLFGLNRQFSAIAGIILLVVSLSFVGINVVGSIAGAVMPAGGMPIITAPVITPTGAVSSAEACWNSVTAELRGTASTGDINLYDYAADSPLSAAVDGAVSYYKTGDITSANGANFAGSLTDTSAATVNLENGKLYTFVGANSTSYYAEPLTLCVNGARPAIALKGYAVATDAQMSSVVYDSTGATALSASSVITNADYTLTMGASEETTVYWKIKQATANKAFWLGAVGTYVGTNMTEASPVSAGFTAVATPQHMQNVAFTFNTSLTITRSYNVYKLTTPRLLLEFEEVKYQFKVKASSNNPVVTAGTDGGALIGFIAKDACWIKGADGTAYFDIHDHTSTEADACSDETDTSPNGKTTGAVVEIA